MKAKWLSIIISLCITAGFFYIRAVPTPVVESVLNRLNHIDYDLRLRFTKKRPYSHKNPIVIVDIDEKSIEQLGRWPWPRSKIADLITRLKKQGVAVIAFDVVFSRDDLNAAKYVYDRLKASNYDEELVLSELDALLPLFNNDRVLSDALQSGDVTLGLFLYNQREMNQENSGSLPKPLVKLEPSLADKHVITRMNSYIGNLPVLHNAAESAGFLTFVAGTDGVVRRVPVLLRYGNDLYPSLALEAVRMYLLEDSIEMRTVQIHDKIVIDNIRLGEFTIPIEPEGRILVPYLGPAKTFPTISVADILSGKDFSEQLSGAIVFVGASAFSLNDLITMPLQKLTYPGVEVHANIAAAILDQQFLHYPAWAVGFEGATILFFGIVLSLLLPFLGSFWTVIVSTMCAAGLIAFDTAMWVQHGLVLPEVLTIWLIVTLAAFHLIFGFSVEGKQRKQIKSMFGQYVPSRYIDKLLEAKKNQSLEGESRDMTVLFADIRNFTGISEQLENANKIKLFLNQLFTPLTEIIFEYGGTVDKYVGDMIIAFWGAPLDDEDHTMHGLEAALAMLEKVESMAEQFKLTGIDKVRISVGLNTGFMNVGDMGSKYRRAYTVLGDSVNLASRIESLTKYYGVNCIITDAVRAKVQGYVYRYLDCVRVKGKDTGVDIYEPLGLAGQIHKKLADRIAVEREAIKAYVEQRFDVALSQFEALHRVHPDEALYTLYIERIKAFQADPPPKDWDGVYAWTTK